MKREFNVGDRVRYVRTVRSGGIWGLQGEVGTVAEVSEQSALVEFDNLHGGVRCAVGSLSHVE